MVCRIRIESNNARITNQYKSYRSHSIVFFVSCRFIYEMIINNKRGVLSTPIHVRMMCVRDFLFHITSHHITSHHTTHLQQPYFVGTQFFLKQSSSGFPAGVIKPATHPGLSQSPSTQVGSKSKFAEHSSSSLHVCKSIAQCSCAQARSSASFFGRSSISTSSIPPPPRPPTTRTVGRPDETTAVPWLL